MSARILIATTRRWIPAARLAMALAKARFTVDAVCPSGHPLRLTGAVEKIHRYHGLRPLHSFAHAIRSARPDVVVPCDDLSAYHLYDLHRGDTSKVITGVGLREVIERSLGPPESFTAALSRSAFIEIAQAEGVRTPKTCGIHGIQQLRDWITQVGYPIVLKADGSSGGEGVRVVRTGEEAERAFQVLSGPPLLARALKRALIDGDTTLVLPSVRRERFAVNAQTFVPGREATSAVACWKGQLLASLHCEVLRVSESAGPATVVRLIHDPEMSLAAEKLVRRLNLSGVCGFDFMRDVDAGRTYLIEMNPRATQIGHLTLGPGRDLPAALYSAATGQPVKPASPATENDTIALFPHEWIRDPQSPYLRSAYHDVPWDAPDLVADCIRKRRPRSARAGSVKGAEMSDSGIASGTSAVGHQQISSTPRSRTKTVNT